MSNEKPRRAKVKITSVVEEIAIVLLDKDGNVEEVEETHEILDQEVTDLHSIISVISVHG